MNSLTKKLVASLLLLSVVGVSSAALITNSSNYYKLESDGTDSVSGNTLTATGGSYTTGIIGNGYKFGTKLNSATSPFTGTGDWTINLWATTTTTGSLQWVADIGNSAQAANTIIYFYVSTGNVLIVDTAGANIITSTLDPTGGAWKMITLTKSGDNFKLYMNATASTTGSRAGINLGSNLWSVGYDNPNSRGSWGGVMDEVGLWTRALSDSEVASLYNSGAPGTAQQYPFSAAAASPTTLGFFRFFKRF